jgi:glycosyltransferase involved in cell wall biosynthesis
MAADGHQTFIIAKRREPSFERRESIEGVTVLRYDAPSKKNAIYSVIYPLVVGLSAFKIALSIRSSSTLFHVHFAAPAILLALFKLPYYYTFHAPAWREISGERQDTYRASRRVERVAVWAYKAIEGFVLRRAQRVFTLSEFMAHEAKSLGVSASSIELVPGGIDFSKFSGGPASSHYVDNQVFVARRLVERTGVEELVTAFAYVIEKFPDAVLRIAGDGPRKSAIEDLIVQLELADHVLLLGRISETDLVMEYKSASLSVVPTQYLEGFGLSTAESLAAGTPVIVTPVGANPELLRGLPQILVAKSADPDSIGSSVVEVLQSPDTLNEVRLRLREGFARKWDWKSVAEAYYLSYVVSRRS